MTHRIDSTASTRSPASWRDVLPIHPAAELFPLMSPDELRVLGELDAAAFADKVANWQLLAADLRALVELREEAAEPEIAPPPADDGLDIPESLRRTAP